MINRIVLVGRLTRDPEVRKTTGGTSVASFTLAVDNRTKNPDGSKTTSFIPCEVWNQTADFAEKFVRRGNLVGVEGRLNQRSYETKDGRKGQEFKVICDSLQLLESKASRTSAPADSGYSPDPVQPDTEEEKNTSSIETVDDNLPF